MARDSTLTIFAPEGFPDFRCSMCGDCCTEPPRITVSAAKVQRLARVLGDSDFPFPVRDALMRDEDDPSAPATFALVGDRCVFLAESGRCRLCELDAAGLRGRWCVAFPVSPIVTPRGVNYSISFACPETARLLRSRQPLQLLALTVEGGGALAADATFGPGHRIPTVRGGPKLDWSAHRLVEGMLLAVARDWKVRLSDRLVVLPILLNRLLDGCDGSASDAQLRERVSQAARRLSEMVVEARSFRPDPEAHYAALAGLFGRRIGLRTRTSLRKLVDDAMRQVRERRSQAGTSDPGAALAVLYREHYKPNASRIEHLLGNYAICRLFTSRETLAGGVYKGVYAVCHLVALARFFATTAAAEQGRRVNLRGLLEAVRVVEKLFASSRRLFDFLDTAPEQDRMQDPATAAALVRL